MITNHFRLNNVWVRTSKGAYERTYAAAGYCDRQKRTLYWTLKQNHRRWDLWERFDHNKQTFPTIESACQEAAYRTGEAYNRNWLAPLDEYPP